jgi:hypothetical protein
MKPITILSVSSVIALLAAGCATHGYTKANSTSAYLLSTSDRILKGVSQIDGATASLTELVEKPDADLTAQFKKFSAAVSGLESVAKDVAARATRIQQLGAAHFQQWDEQLAKIQNEDIRNDSAARKAAVMKQFNEVKASYDETRAAFNPLLADMRDIRTAISTDLTPAGVEAIRKSMTKVNDQGARLRQSLEELAVKFKDLGKALETPAPPPAEKTEPAAKK